MSSPIDALFLISAKRARIGSAKIKAEVISKVQ